MCGLYFEAFLFRSTQTKKIFQNKKKSNSSVASVARVFDAFNRKAFLEICTQLQDFVVI